MSKKKKKNSLKENIKEILNSYKTIIYISFLINIVLLVVCYSYMTSNKIYSFSGSDEYLKVRDGIIVLNKDVNILNGNNITYVKDKDYSITSFKIGYYVMDNNKLIEIISESLELETDVKLSEIVNNFTSFNITEKDSEAMYFTKDKKELINDGLYIVLDAKTEDGESIYSKLKLNVSKVSKF